MTRIKTLTACFILLLATWDVGVGLRAEDKTPAASAPAAPALITLETGAVRLGIDPQRHGAIVSLVDKASETEFIAPGKGLPMLYALRFANPQAAPGASTTLTEADAEAVTVRREGETVVIAAARHKGAPVQVECRFRTEPGSPLIYCRLTVDTHGGAALESATFPALAWPALLGPDPDRDTVVFPRADGCLSTAPSKNGWLGSCAYPGLASMQFLARYSAAAGVYVAALDSQGFTKSFGVERRSGKLLMALQHLPARQAGGAWRMDYDVAIGTFHGDWQAAADLYKSWAVGQPWCRRTLAERVRHGDVPGWLAEPSLFETTALHGDYEASLARASAAWRRVLGVPMTFILIGWEKKGAWITPDYFPPNGGESRFTSATAAMHARDDHAMVFLSGLNWTLHKKFSASVYDDSAEFERRGAASAIRGTDGKPAHYFNPDMGEYAQICPATPLAREMLMGTARECQRLGSDCIAADQIVGGGMPLCFCADHGHPVGGGNWSAAAIYRLYDEIRREGRKRNPAFAWSMEEPGEFFIPVLDTYHARDYAQVRWPRDGENVIGIPLFTHVYHEYLNGYGGESKVSAAPNAEWLYQQGMNLVCGKTPTVATWGQSFDPAATDPAQARLLRAHCELWRGAGKDFLVYGTRLTTPPLDVPQHALKFFGGTGRPARTIQAPAVLTGRWRAPDGRIGRVCVGIAATPVTCEVDGEKITLAPGEVMLIVKKP